MIPSRLNAFQESLILINNLLHSIIIAINIYFCSYNIFSRIISNQNFVKIRIIFQISFFSQMPKIFFSRTGIFKYIQVSDKIVIVLSNLPARYRSTIKIDGSLLMEVEGRSLGWYIRIRGVRIETKQIKWRGNNTIGLGDEPWLYYKVENRSRIDSLVHWLSP